MKRRGIAILLLTPLLSAMNGGNVVEGKDLSGTLLVLAENEEIATSADVPEERAALAVQASLKKRDEYLEREEELLVKEELRLKLEQQILDTLDLLNAELASTEVREEATGQQVAKLETFLRELQEARGEDVVAVTMRKTVVDKKAEHNRQQLYVTNLRDRVAEIQEKMNGQQENSSLDLEELARIRSVIVSLEEQSLLIAETHEGAVGQTTREELRECVEARQEVEEVQEEQAWYQRCTIC